MGPSHKKKCASKMDPRSDHIRLLRLLLLREAVTSLVVWLSRLWHCPKWKWFNFTAFTTHYCFFCGPVRCRWWTKSFSPREAMRGCPRVSQFQLLAFMDFPHCPGRSGCRLSVVFLCSTFETISYALGWTEKKTLLLFRSGLHFCWWPLLCRIVVVVGLQVTV